MSRTRVATLLAAAALLLSGCGSEPPAKLSPMQPDAPADLCSAVPAAAKAGLQTSSTSDTTGDPTAACSLRTASGVTPEVHGVVTWLQLDDDGTADSVYASQCRAVDHSVYRTPSGVVTGSDKSCGGSGRVGRADSATLASVAGRTVMTVRWSSAPPQSTSAMARSTQVMEAMLHSLASGS